MKTALLGIVVASVAACAVTQRAAPGAALGAQIADSATTMVGQPYRYGGSAPGGFDCSGLVMYAAKAAGISLPRTAQEQELAGSAIPRRDLRAGDLVFMRLSGKILHVGIALDREHFVHAPSAHGRVRIDSLSAKPYAHGFLTARRVADGGADYERTVDERSADGRRASVH